MRPRGAILSALAASAALAFLLHLGASSDNAELRASARAGEPTRASDWSMMLKPNGGIRVLYKGSTVAESNFVFWGPNWKWAGGAFKLDWTDEGDATLSGRVADLKTELAGKVLWPRPNVVAMDLQWSADEGVGEATGGGWEWRFHLDSPTFGGDAPAPKALDGNAGWVWRFAPDQEITLRFDPPAAKVYIEPGRKDQIRTFFLADRVEPGVKRFRVSLSLPEGASRTLSPQERYGPTDTAGWFPGALTWDASPVDLSFLNKDHRPAGRDGFVRVDGDRLVFGDGTPARFWGANLAAYALFSTPRETVPLQAHRMAQLGYNLMRIHHHDARWAQPNIFGRDAKSTRRLDPASLEAIDWWIKCLKDEGVYVWIDMEVDRVLREGDQVGPGAKEIVDLEGGLKGFNYYNDDVRKLMIEFQEQYLNHVNPHTGLAYKDDPAVMGVLLTNENDLVHHFGNKLLPNKNHPFHNALFTRDYKAFAAQHGLPEAKVFETWKPGPSKIYLNDVEHRFNAEMIGRLRAMGVRSAIATTSYWGDEPLYTLPALADGDVIDAHAYGAAESLSADPRYEATLAHWIGAAQVAGKPLTATEWNVPHPAVDRFTTPLYIAATAALQGWDAPMLFNYSQDPLKAPQGLKTWSTYPDVAITGIMPAAALAYRRGDVAPAQKTYYLDLSPEQLFDHALDPKTSATIRTLMEQSRLTIGLPAVKELPWLKPTQAPAGAIRIDDPDRDMIPPGQSEVRSDTGEVARDWRRGIHVIDAARTQSVAGWIGGEDLRTADARFRIQTKKAVVALSSLDGEPLSKSRLVLVTAVARAVASPGNRLPVLSEPVRGEVVLKTEVPNFQLLALSANSRVAGRMDLKRDGDGVSLPLPAVGGTHWYVLAPASGK